MSLTSYALVQRSYERSKLFALTQINMQLEKKCGYRCCSGLTSAADTNAYLGGHIPIKTMSQTVSEPPVPSYVFWNFQSRVDRTTADQMPCLIRDSLPFPVAFEHAQVERREFDQFFGKQKRKDPYHR